MKNKAQVLREYSEYKTLINAVVNRIGLDSVEDVNCCGIDKGFNMFIYYTDTHSFSMRHRKQILLLIKNTAEQLGYKNMNDMVMGFNCVNNDDNDYQDLCKYVAGSPCQPSIVTNALAWFAAEEVCRMFEN
jgi:hypothetical protein